MSRKSFCGIGLSLFVVFAAVQSAAMAQTPATPTTAPKQHTGSPLIHALRSAHKLLATADHDYDGHRAAAAKEVGNALKDLGYHHKKPQQAATAANGTANNGAVVAKKAAGSGQAATREPQATSDAQMLQAQQILQTALTQMNVSHHPKAAANIKAAICEINKALAIR